MGADKSSMRLQNAENSSYLLDKHNAPDLHSRAYSKNDIIMLASDSDVSLPYGHSFLHAHIPEHANLQVVTSRTWAVTSQTKTIEAALANPIGTPKLRDLARGKRRVAIVTCDKTRSVPSRITLPRILDELEAAGLDRASVTILVATGLHKGETMTDLRERLGDELLGGLDPIIHDSDDQNQLISLGHLRSGTPLSLNKVVVESDLVVVESTVEPHFFAGFTGGSKMILPGLAGTDTILRNHAWNNIDDSRSRYGVLDNSVRAEGNETLRYLGKTFALNLVLDSQKQICFATCGEILASFALAAREVSKHSAVQVAERPDVVLTTNGGYPLDRNLYQCVKGIAVPEEIVHKGSRIIMASECIDGVAHANFLKSLVSGTPHEVYNKLKSSTVPIPDQWQVQILCRILRQNPVWFVTGKQLESEIESAHMHYASTIEEALRSAQLTQGERVLAVPEGPGMILKPA